MTDSQTRGPASGLVLNLLLFTFHIGISGKTFGVIGREPSFLVLTFHNLVNALGGARSAELQPEEDDRLTEQHADRGRGDADGDTDHDGQEDKGEETTGKRERRVSESVVVSAVMHAWAVVRSTELSGADVVMSGEVGRLAVGSRVACQTHAEALHLLGGGCGGSSGGSSLGAGFGHDGTEFGHNAAHHVGALGVRIVGANWNGLDRGK